MRFSLARIGLGLLLIALGVGLLLDMIDAVDFGSFARTWWPVILVLGGLLVILDTPRNWLWGVVLVCAGGVFLLSNLDVIEVSVGRLIAPVVLLGLGTVVLIGALGTSRPAPGGSRVLALFGGNELRVGQEEFTGAQLSAVFGGVELDLREASIRDGAVIDLFTFAGGVEIRLPAEARVVNQVSAFLGGVEDKSKATGPDGPRLHLRGQAMLGGLELRN